MTIDLHPEPLGVLLPLTTLSILAAVAVGGALFVLRAGRLGMGMTAAYGLALWAVFWGIVGARLFHVLDHASLYAAVPLEAFYLWNGGLALWGGLIGGAAAGAWRFRALLTRLPGLADACTTPVLVGIAIGRLGGLAAGAWPGHETGLPWGVTYTHAAAEAYAGGAAVHPVAGYELVLVLLMLAGSLVLRNRSMQPGAHAATLLAAYAVGRFAISFTRLDPIWAGLDAAQWTAIAAVVLAALWLTSRPLPQRSP